MYLIDVPYRKMSLSTCLFFYAQFSCYQLALSIHMSETWSLEPLCSELVVEHSALLTSSYPSLFSDYKLQGLCLLSPNRRRTMCSWLAFLWQSQPIFYHQSWRDASMSSCCTVDPWGLHTQQCSSSWRVSAPSREPVSMLRSRGSYWAQSIFDSVSSWLPYVLKVFILFLINSKYILFICYCKLFS